MQNPDSRQNAIPGVWSIMNPVRGRIHLAMALAGLSAAFALLALCALAWAAHALFALPGQWPWQAFALAALSTALAFVLRLTAFDQSHCAAFRLERLLRADLAEHLARLPLGYVQQAGSGALAKVMMDDVKSLHIFVADSTPLYARAYVSPLLTFLLLFGLDWRLALSAAAVLAAGLLILSLAMRGSGEMARLYNETGENVSKAVVEYVQAMPVVRTFDTGVVTFGRYQKALEDYRDVVTRWYRMAGFSGRLSRFIMSPLPTLAALVWLGAWLLERETLDIASWLAVLLVGTGMAESLMPLMALKRLVNKTQMSIRRIHEVMAAPVLPMPVVGQPQTSQTPQDASVCFEHVDFRYTADGPLVLRDVSFAAPAGSVTALVGPSGAGKTTVARLIPRFWDVSAGSVRVGGVDVREMSAETLMRQVAFVFQDTFLFADTLANNIRLGLPEATMDEVIAAARAAQAHDFIMALPQGYETLAGERGAFLSGGQRQRVTIARAILQNRPILVLDEATAFADPENEAALVAALSHLMRGKTVLMVAHRLSTIRDADQILAFDQGRLVERGRHDALVAQEGVYTRLWRNFEQAQHWALTAIHGETA
jgi:ATP-binding cassette subfamily B protein